MVNEIDSTYMQRCLWLARQGRLLSRPNPMVGAVIVSHDGRILGEGYHARCGEGHAEVNAFGSVSSADQHLLADSTIYVSLEPCSHQGRTPPCADLIVNRGVRRCVVGTQDPFARVQGRGIARMRAAGIDVTVGVMEAECRWLNRRFFTFHSEGRPYVILKWAQSADGYMDDHGHAATFSTPATLQLMHRLRQREDAIVVGHTTWQREHPRLDSRLWGKSARADGLPMPQRFVLSHTTDFLPTGYLVATSIDNLMAQCRERELQSLIVEGGRQTLQAFICSGMYDELRIETAQHKTGGGTPAPTLPQAVKQVSQTVCDGNSICRYIRIKDI